MAPCHPRNKMLTVPSGGADTVSCETGSLFRGGSGPTLRTQPHTEPLTAKRGHEILTFATQATP
jgi:hypothetical protein